MMEVELKSYEIGEIQYHKNLAIASLFGRSSSLDYLVLSEALQKGLQITENPKGTRVNQVYAYNKTGKEVLGITRELIAGATQNRVLVRNIYFENGFEGEIPVRCIERGQPTIENASFQYSGIAPTTIVAAECQIDTWSCVENYGKETDLVLSKGNLSEIYEKKKETFQDFAGNYSRLETQLGVVVSFMMDGRKNFILDVFDKPDSFKKYFDSLLKSYILESGLNSENEVSLTKDEAMKFLDSLDRCEFKEISPISLGRDFKINGDNLRGSSISYDGTFIYTNLFSDFNEKKSSRYAAQEVIDDCITMIA